MPYNQRDNCKWPLKENKSNCPSYNEHKSYSLSRYCAEVRNSNTIDQSRRTICRERRVRRSLIDRALFLSVRVPYTVFFCVRARNYPFVWRSLRFGRWHVLLNISFRTSVVSPTIFSWSWDFFVIFLVACVVEAGMQIWRFWGKNTSDLIRVWKHMVFEKNKSFGTSALLVRLPSACTLLWSSLINIDSLERQIE